MTPQSQSLVQPLTTTESSHRKRPTRLTAPAQLSADVRGNQLFVQYARAHVRAIVQGDDPRLLVVVGPCSIDDPVTALSYAEALTEVQRATADSLLVCMRTYFEKPRTTVGWKG